MRERRNRLRDGFARVVQSLQPHTKKGMNILDRIPVTHIPDAEHVRLSARPETERPRPPRSKVLVTTGSLG